MDFNPARFVDRLQQAWQQRDWHELAEMYHPEAVLLPPDLGETLVGRDSILQTYREFDDQAHLHAFERGDPGADALDRCGRGTRLRRRHGRHQHAEQQAHAGEPSPHEPCRCGPGFGLG